MQVVTRVLKTAASLLLGVALAIGVVDASPAVAAGKATATTTLNVRSGPGTTSAVVGTLTSGQTVTTLSASGGWTRIRFASRTAYVASRYLTKQGSSPAPAAGSVVGGSVRTASTALKLRRGAGPGFAVLSVLPRGTRVTMTGRTSAGFGELYAGRARGWSSLQYLRTGTALPAVIGTRTTTAALNLRTGSGAGARTVGEVRKGSKVSITGVTANGRAQIVHAGAVRWVTARYLSVTKPRATSTGSYAVERGLKPNAIKVHRAARARFPRITTYYGVRNDAIPDHPSGRALDLMIPSYRSASGRALGREIATWARANARSLGIQYVIWDQRIWNIQRDKEGWRPMTSRGNDSANHKDHVHITVYG